MKTRQTGEIVAYVCERLENGPPPARGSDLPADQTFRDYWTRLMLDRMHDSLEKSLIGLVKKKGENLGRWIEVLQDLGYCWAPLTLPLDYDETECGNILHFLCFTRHSRQYIPDPWFRDLELACTCALKDCDPFSTTNRNRTALDILAEQLSIDQNQQYFEYYKRRYVQDVPCYLDLARYILQKSPECMTGSFMQCFLRTRESIHVWVRDEDPDTFLWGWCQVVVEDNLSLLCACIENISAPLPPLPGETAEDLVQQHYEKHVRRVFPGRLSLDQAIDAFVTEVYPNCFRGNGWVRMVNYDNFKQVRAEGACACEKMKRFFKERGLDRAASVLLLYDDNDTLVYFIPDQLDQVRQPYGDQPIVHPTSSKLEELRCLGLTCACGK